LELQAEVEDKPLLCHKCERQILPQLKQPGWARLIGFQAPPVDEPEAEAEPAVAKAQRRNSRKYSKRSQIEEGLTCYFCPGGCGTPVNAFGLICGPCGEEKRTVASTRKVSGVHCEGLRQSARPAA
jgi:hypothetical protein